MVTTILIVVHPILFSFLPSEWLEKNYFEDSKENFKYILLWNTFFEDESFGLKYLVGDSWRSKETFSKLQCSQFNCSVVNERSYFHHFTSFDAVVFHERNLQNSDLPNQRSPEQLFVHFNLEAPFHSSIHGF